MYFMGVGCCVYGCFAYFDVNSRLATLETATEGYCLAFTSAFNIVVWQSSTRKQVSLAGTCTRLSLYAWAPEQSALQHINLVDLAEGEV